MGILTFHLDRITYVLVIIVKIDQKTKHAKWEIITFQSMQNMNLLWCVNMLALH